MVLYTNYVLAKRASVPTNLSGPIMKRGQFYTTLAHNFKINSSVLTD